LPCCTCWAERERVCASPWRRVVRAQVPVPRMWLSDTCLAAKLLLGTGAQASSWHDEARTTLKAATRVSP
jgi:hypothetical protein